MYSGTVIALNKTMCTKAYSFGNPFLQIWGISLGPIILKNKELNLTQTEISEKIGLTQANISKIFSFEAVPKLSTIAKLLDLYGLEVKVQEKPTENNSQKNN